MNKSAMELSINFLVVLILSIVVFIGGLALMKNIFFESQNLHSSLTQKAIGDIEKLMSNGEKVALPKPKVTLKRGKDYVFGLGIYNVIRDPPETEFTILVDFTKAIDQDGNQITNVNEEYINQNWHTYGCKDVTNGCTKIKKTLKNNEKITLPILMKAALKSDEHTSTPKGIYIFNVEVTYPELDSDGNPTGNTLTYDRIKKLYVEVI